MDELGKNSSVYLTRPVLPRFSRYIKRFVKINFSPQWNSQFGNGVFLYFKTIEKESYETAQQVWVLVIKTSGLICSLGSTW